MIGKVISHYKILSKFGGRAMGLVSRSAIIATLLIQSRAPSQIHDLQFEHLTVEQGLPSNTVFGILQDSRGFMWFGTGDAGLCKFDGYSFTVYKYDPLDSNSIPSNNINQIYEDGSGTLWLFGCVRFERATGKFTSYKDLEAYPSSAYATYTRPPHMHEDMSGALWFASQGLNKFDRTSGTFTRYSLSNDTLYAICGDPDDGRIFWIGTARGLDRFDRENGTFAHYDHGSRNVVNTIHGDKFGFLWIGTNEGLYKFNKVTGAFSYYPVGKKSSGSLERTNVGLIYEDNRGLLWISTEAGLFRFNRATRKFKEYKNDDASARSEGRQVMAILEDRSGELWVGMLGGGVAKYDRPKDKFTFYVNDPKDPHSLSNNDVTRIYEDRSGTLWIGTWWGGLNKVDRARKAFTHYTLEPADPKSLSDKIVTGLVEDRSGVLWVGTMGGLNRFNRETETFTHYMNDPNNPQSLGSSVIRCVLADSRGTIWVGTLGRGLDRLDPVKSGGTGQGKERFIHYTHDAWNPNSLGSNYILSLFEDTSGRLWIGTRDEGLDEFDRNSGKFIHYKHDPKDPNSLGWNWVNAIYEDKSGALWVGTATVNALNKLDRATGKFTRYYCDPKDIKSLSFYSVHSIYEDSRGTLWIGTASGLNRFDRSTETFTHFTTKDGIASDFIGAILEDDSGYLWLKTLKGVSKFDPRTGTFRNYDASDGVNINPSWGKASWKNRNGEMFIGGTNGFVRFYPDSIKDNTYIPPIVITAFKQFDIPVLLDTVISEKKVLELSYQDNVFSFEFVALNYTSPGANQYAYKLEGFDKDWIYCGTRRYASYTNLEGGSYVFKVKGTNNDGVWNETGTSIAVIITPPFWKTWWFRTIFLVTVAVSIGGTVRHIGTRKWRLKLRGLEQEHALERERLRISRDMHDEVGANLTEIAILSELVKRDILKPEEAETNVQKISERARKLIDNISEIIWAINPRNDKLDNLTGYLREFASEYFEITPIMCRFNFPEQMFSHPLSAEVRRNIFLTMKEAINNVVKHSGATSVELNCIVSDREVEFSIQDNGKGLAIEDVSLQGNGLLNMRKRIEDINGNFQIESQPGSGTRIRLIVPLT
jgi:ligand-binding sensor domain-containing protein/signal transduction histidine kinase